MDNLVGIFPCQQNPVTGRSRNAAIGRTNMDAAIEQAEILELFFGEFLAAAGFGVTEKICEGLFDLGVDALTLGNHAWDQRETLTYIDREPRLLRPANYPAGSTPGKGANLIEAPQGRGRQLRAGAAAARHPWSL